MTVKELIAVLNHANPNSSIWIQVEEIHWDETTKKSFKEYHGDEARAIRINGTTVEIHSCWSDEMPPLPVEEK